MTVFCLSFGWVVRVVGGLGSSQKRTAGAILYLARTRTYVGARGVARAEKRMGSTAAHCVFSRAAWLSGVQTESGREEEGEEGNDSTEGGSRRRGRGQFPFCNTLRHQTGGKPREGRKK